LAQDIGSTTPTWHLDNAADLFRIFRQLNINTSGTEMMSITNAGNVGIGTSTASYTLTVAGTTWCNYGYWTGSDANLKMNVLPISDSLSTVLKLSGVSYEWKDNYSDVQKLTDGTEVLKKKNPEGRHYGVIAQEIEKILPEVVKEDASGTKAVAYNEIIPVLIEAIKEQQKQIDQQNKDIVQLKSILSSKQ